LSEYGLRTVGIDLSPEMIGLARAAHPGVTYEVGDMLALPAGDGEWFGLVAMYSIVHFDDSQLSVAAGEFARVLRPGAPALVAFHGGDEIRHVEDFFGRGVELDFRLFDPAAVVAALEGAGLHVEAHLERDAYLEIEAPTRRVYLLCRRT
ncbi:MAG TPA: class I SAM-dependent methyltransferase, partial [Acidimicrobiales bacterium]|nr:class I SAM-dependent methyltransferase [Acidimicrobiales bacterium]